MGCVETDGSAEVAHVTESNEIIHESVVAKECSAFGEHGCAAPALRKFHEYVLHFRRRHELSLLHIHRSTGGGSSDQQIGLTAEKRGDLQEVHDTRGSRSVRGIVNVGRDRHAEFFAYALEFREALFDAESALRVDARTIGFIETRFEDERELKLRAR